MNKQLGDFLTIDDFEVAGRTVLFRADINSVVVEGRVEMKERIQENAKTIRELSEKGARVVVFAHQGRVGRADFLPLNQHAELLRRFVDLEFVEDIIGPAARAGIKNLGDGEVLLLDNVRMLAEETLSRSPEEHAKSIFVRRLAPLADIYINDAFSVAHRSHASVVGFPRALKEKGVGAGAVGIGRLMERELVALEKAVHSIKKPCVYVLGGVKPEEVLDVMEHTLRRGKVNTYLTAGSLGTLFLYARNIIEPSEEQKADEEFMKTLERAKRILAEGGEKIKYPEDVAVDLGGRREEIPVEQLKPKQQIYDIGERTSEDYAEQIKDARTVIMKGPAGLYEKEEFAEGTRELLKAVSSSDAFSLLGGGHTSAAISTLGMSKSKMSNAHVSLAGGAFLKYLLGNHLPGIEVLRKH